MIDLKHFLASIFMAFVVISNVNAQTVKDPVNKDVEAVINENLDAWHKAAAEANFNSYFNLMTTDGVFIGTDASEHWGIKAFKAYSKPHFDKGKAWSFTVLERHVYINDDKVAWFDELLNTQMGVCRGSGVMKFEGGTWKVAHYVLSATIPNEKMKDVITLKSVEDSTIIESLD